MSCCFVCLQNHLPSWQVKEDTQFVSKKTFDFHKFAEKFNTNSVSQRWNTDSNELAEDFVLSKSPNPLSSTADSGSENEDEIFLVFRGKPNSRVSSFDECQAASGKFDSNNYLSATWARRDMVFLLKCPT